MASLPRSECDATWRHGLYYSVKKCVQEFPDGSVGWGSSVVTAMVQVASMVRVQSPDSGIIPGEGVGKKKKKKSKSKSKMEQETEKFFLILTFNSASRRKDKRKITS